MLHNSLHRRDLLLAMNANPHVVHRRDVHRNVPRRGTPTPTPSQISLTGPWIITTAHATPAETLVAADATDFLRRIGGGGDAEHADQKILFEIGSCPAGFRTLVEPGRVEVHAADAAALWAGWVHLENQIRSAGGPLLTKGETLRRPAWPVQIAPPTWGSNYAVPDLSPDFLPDDTFRSLAHAGADGMFIYGDWLCYADNTPLPELNHPDAPNNIATLKSAAARAAGYGIQLHFVLVSPKLPDDHPLFKRLPNARGALLQHVPGVPPIHCLCSSDPDALSFHAATLGNLFKQIPTLGGVVCIIGGESYYHCFMRSAGSPIGQTNCPHCHGKLAEDVIANLLKVTADAIHQHAPAAKVMAWPYSAQGFWSTERDQLALIDRLPPGVGLLSEIDKEELLHKDGYDKLCWDYSVEVDTPSDRIVAQSLRCAQVGRELSVKTETSHGVELLHLPYVPCLTRSARRWQSLRALRPTAVLQRWGFIGMFDSAAERLGYLARWEPSFSPDSACDDVARQLIGPDLAPTVVRAWRQFDQAVSHLPTLVSGGYYIGPLFLGPACPLPTWTGPTPTAFLGNFFYLAEVDPTGSTAHLNGNHDNFTLHTAAQLDSPSLDIQQRQYAAARDLAAAGHALLQKLDPAPLDPATRDELLEQQSIGEYLYRTLRTCANLTRFLHTPDKATATDELENATAATALYERAPWLNHSLRLDVGAPESLGMMREKIRLLQDYIKT